MVPSGTHIHQQNFEVFMRPNLALVTIVLFIHCLVAGTGNAAAQGDPPSEGNFFTKLGVGGAVGWTHNLGKTIVKGASSPNGIVRIDSEQNDQVRPWVEVHAWFYEWNEWGGMDEGDPLAAEKKNRWGIGPFVAVAPGANFVDSVAMGIMLGRKYKTESESNLSFNLAVGAALNLNQQSLAVGFNANQPLPPGETSVRYQTKSTGAVLVMFSIGWDAFGGTTRKPSQGQRSQRLSPVSAGTAFTNDVASIAPPTNTTIGPERPTCLNAVCAPIVVSNRN
jgi:hypothetical protein